MSEFLFDYSDLAPGASCALVDADGGAFLEFFDDSTVFNAGVYNTEGFDPADFTSVNAALESLIFGHAPQDPAAAPAKQPMARQLSSASSCVSSKKAPPYLVEQPAPPRPAPARAAASSAAPASVPVTSRAPAAAAPPAASAIPARPAASRTSSSYENMPAAARTSLSYENLPMGASAVASARTSGGAAKDEHAQVPSSSSSSSSPTKRAFAPAATASAAPAPADAAPVPAVAAQGPVRPRLFSTGKDRTVSPSNKMFAISPAGGPTHVEPPSADNPQPPSSPGPARARMYSIGRLSPSASRSNSFSALDFSRGGTAPAAGPAPASTVPAPVAAPIPAYLSYTSVATSAAEPESLRAPAVIPAQASTRAAAASNGVVAPVPQASADMYDLVDPHAKRGAVVAAPVAVRSDALYGNTAAAAAVASKPTTTAPTAAAPATLQAEPFYGNTAAVSAAAAPAGARTARASQGQAAVDVSASVVSGDAMYGNLARPTPASARAPASAAHPSASTASQPPRPPARASVPALTPTAPTPAASDDIVSQGSYGSALAAQRASATVTTTTTTTASAASRAPIVAEHAYQKFASGEETGARQAPVPPTRTTSLRPASELGDIIAIPGYDAPATLPHQQQQGSSQPTAATAAYHQASSSSLRAAPASALRPAYSPTPDAQPLSFEGAYDQLNDHSGSPPKEGPVWHLAPIDVDAYKRLPVNQQPHSAVPECVRSKTFNRHMDVLPNPATKVTLMQLPNDPTSSYINANYVRGWDGRREYICTQGPLPDTQIHFWRMVVENGVDCVIMATGLTEKGEVKCEDYFPREPSQAKTFGALRVACVARQQAAAFDTTLLEVSFKVRQRDGTNSVRAHMVKHFWYHAWPDHGVPRTTAGKPDPTHILSMLMAARAHREDCAARVRLELQNKQKPAQKSGGPMVVHCSAGVGRSGTIIAIDTAIEQLRNSGYVDVTAVVTAMRHDRVMLVQHPGQYELAWEAARVFAEWNASSYEIS